jgi:hypothetical protein
MYIPRHWFKATGGGRTPDGREFPVSVWGCADDEHGAERNAGERLRRVLERIRCGDPLPNRYGYGTRPLREEILQTLESEVPGEAAAIITRNGYGAQVLNTARLLFLDVDRPAVTFWQRLAGWFGAKPAPSEESVLAKVRDALRQHGRGAFRIYRTAAGWRIVAVDREFDPTGDEAQELMRATGTDPAFSRLCQVQRSFRARLTPKPWRCKSAVPPGEHPRLDEEARQRFASWLGGYERAATAYATCRYLETVGDGAPSASFVRLIAIHDQITRCSELLPLA